MGILYRKSQKVSAHNLDHKGVEKGVLSDPGPEDPPPTLIGLRLDLTLGLIGFILPKVDIMITTSNLVFMRVEMVFQRQLGKPVPVVYAEHHTVYTLTEQECTMYSTGNFSENRFGFQ